jgi:hypothetical protein
MACYGRGTCRPAQAAINKLLSTMEGTLVLDLLHESGCVDGSAQ